MTEKVRKNILFDQGWRFKKGDMENGYYIDFHDSNWEILNLPHDWSIEGPFNKNNPSGRSGAFLPRGIGWYRKHFNISEKYRDKIVTIEFDGVYMNSDVWINGVHLGNRPYGYVSFYYDLTPYLKIGNNVIAVRVDNSEEPNSRWYPGSGIYRHTWIVITDKLHIDKYGIYITTPQVSFDLATVSVKTTIKNEYNRGKRCSLCTKIFDENGNKIKEKISSVFIQGNDIFEFSQEIKIESPRLWSPDTPTLYHLHSILIVDDKVIDSTVTPFGIREIKLDKDKGFMLNGKTVKMKGVNIHDDAGCVGVAVPERVLERRLEKLKSIGCNAIRTSHNPPASELLDMCDRMGFLVIDEAFDKWYSGYYGEVFDEWWERDIEAMLLRDRNHPSIVMWSVGNEIEDQGSERMIKTLKKLVNYVHTKEPTRPVTCALAPERDGSVEDKVKIVTKMAKEMDVLSCNYHEPFYELYRRENPEIIILGSETFTFFRGTIYDIKAFDDKNPWFDVMEKNYVIGQFLWSGIDYLGEAEPWPSKGWSAGIIDTCGFLKPRAYFFKSVWSKSPMVHIAVFDDRMETNPEKLHWNWPKIVSHWTFPYFKNDIVRFITFTNCEEVELFVNGVSKGTKYLADFPDHMMIWYVPYEEGHVKAVGKLAGEKVCVHELHTAGEPARIELKPDTKEIMANGRDVVHIEVMVVDDRGVLVPYADNDITFHINGCGKIIGVDNGDLCSNELYKTNQRKAYKGRALVIIQSTTEEGQIEFTANSPDLESCKVFIRQKKKHN